MSVYPPVHILMPTYNVAPFIQSSLSSILRQKYDNITTIIIDDGSLDSTKQKLQNFTINKSSFKVYCESKNEGIATRRDQLINLSKDIDPNSFFLWLDADDVINDSNFVSTIVNQMIKTKADICLYSFKIKYESDSKTLRSNAKELIKDRDNSEKILAHIFKSKGRIISVEDYPEVATYSSLGWTKAYAPSAKKKWPQSDHRYIYEDFSYMAAIFYAKGITALEPNYRPINYLRRSYSATGNRVPEHFYIDIIMQLLKFRENLNNMSLLKKVAANRFIDKKLLQYENTLRVLIESGTHGFSELDLIKFQKAKNIVRNFP